MKRQCERNTIDQYKVVNEFLCSCGRATRSYKSVLSEFFKFIEKNPNDYIIDIRLLDEKERIKKTDEYSNDVARYLTHIDKLSPTTKQNYTSVIVNFFKFWDIGLSYRIMKRIKNVNKAPKTRTKEKQLTYDTLSKILMFGDTLEKAAFLTMVSSGMRPDEVIQLKLDNIHIKEGEPTQIDVIHDPDRRRFVKNNQSRPVFISDEATRFVKLWLAERGNWLKKAVERTHITTFHGRVFKSVDDDRLFPLSQDMLGVKWNKLCRRAGVYEADELTGYNRTRCYMLRKFFKSNFRVKNHEENDLYRERLLGHDGYLNGTYWKKSIKELSDFYKQGMDTVTIFERKDDSREENQKLRQEIEELKRQLENDKERIKKNVAEWVDVFLKDAVEAGKFLRK